MQNLIKMYINEHLNESSSIIIPKPGDIIRLDYIHPEKPSLKKNIVNFHSRIFIGLCINVNKKNLTTTFTLRNVIKKKVIEFTFFLHSPLLKNLKIFSQKKGIYRRSKLFFLRKKAIHYSKLRLITRK
jgi:ribosomal protein L19